MSPVAKYWDGTAWQEVGYATAAPRLVTALPASPNDGDEVYYLADATAGIVWHLRYRATSSSAYKWEYVGGPPLSQLISTFETHTSTSYANLATLGPQITIPLAGDYMLALGAYARTSVVGFTAFMSFDGPGFGAGDAWGVRNDTAAASGGAQVHKRWRNPMGGGTFTAKYRVSGASTGGWGDRTFEATPIRVG